MFSVNFKGTLKIEGIKERKTNNGHLTAKHIKYTVYVLHVSYLIIFKCLVKE